MNTMEHLEGGSVGQHRKDTAVKAGWEFKTLGEVCDIRNGSTPAKSNSSYWDNGTIPWFTIDDIREQGRIINRTRQKITTSALSETSVKLLPADSVLLCCTASVGEVAITRIPLTTNQQFNGLVIQNSLEVYPDFLYHYASTLKEVLLSLSGKTTIDFVPISRLRDIPIPLPPLAEQQRIVAILDEAFADIATARANAVKNLENARALFESHLEAVFSKRGEGWVEKRLEEVCNLLPGYAFKSADYINASKTLNIRMSNIRPGGSFDSEHNQKFLPDSYAKKYSAYSLYEGDLIIAMTDMAGDPKILGVPTLVRNLNGRNFLMNQRVGKLFDFTPDVCQRYLRYFLTSPSVKKYYKTKGAGGLQINISKGDILSVVVPLPNVEHQDCVTQQLDALRDETNRLEDIYTQKIAALDALKKSLLHQAFSGEL